MLNFQAFNCVNNFSERLKIEYNANKKVFYAGNILKTTASLCFKTCPYSVIAVLFTEEGFNKCGEDLIALLEKHNLSPVKLIISKGELDRNIELIAKALPENVRLILTVDIEHLYNAQALAVARELECVIGLTSFPDRFFYSASAPITQLVFDDVEYNQKRLYEIAVSKIISLIDIKVKQFFKILPSKSELLTEFIELLDIALYGKEDNLLESAIKLELMENALGHYEKPLDIKTALCLVKVLATNLDKTFYGVPNYIDRAKRASEIYGLSYLETLEMLKAQLDEQEKFKENISDIRKGIGALARIYEQKIGDIISKYLSFGGSFEESNNNKDMLLGLKFNGDIHYYNNSLSLLRETGYLEKIKV